MKFSKQIAWYSLTWYQPHIWTRLARGYIVTAAIQQDAIFTVVSVEYFDMVTRRYCNASNISPVHYRYFMYLTMYDYFFFFVFIYLYKMHPMIVTTKIHVYYVSGSFYSHFLRFTRHFFHGASMWAERRKKRLPANRVELLLTIASVAINSTNAQNIYTTFFSSFIEYQHSATHFFLLHISSTRSAGTFCLLPECYLCRFSRIQCAMNSFILSRSSVRCNNETMRHTLQRRKKANKKKRNLQTCSGTRQCIFIRIDSEGHRISTLCWKIQ